MHEWKLWEVFVRKTNGLSHRHIGSVQASDSVMALQYARDIFTRRGELVSIWVIPSEDLVSSDPKDRESWFETAEEKNFRHATFYEVPTEVTHL
ncbi:1,2-phenylacetyl-CoA epoxidase subunit B [Xenorhabdus nematophila]|uniref:1,2-phenylacetyl-CoA epoxidase subunit PaaB n=1 Tax=Xenorhabdus nematophila TaxID=628 RepID=UPI0003275896|nr:1,2-phenylacetyl-CoA epoxidase subunit PaaB [Xenorhabdus nematophila]CEF29456.1 putative multicomponent oxygenase/reductase subunit for phenylacetic acid degradation [Xenorhabdus nematophila str. Websteri]KHD27591.1 phenylacetate-CoA oxygenase [Xenorhabdus nematophila]MBA0018823.1 1,2-phenylacetyl-CoA epoxidase subunit B [Xenorhabdus nematophila]MCB4426532.1 1,2-phenylacetyl-CoA epoxidase subunit B [Xenorhabdus nematophila]CCW28988.1 Phenylacetic acid degradation protein paaB [Xenorhabdus n